MKKAVVFDFDGTLTELTLNFDSLRVETERIAEKYVPKDTIRGLRDQYILEMVFAIEKMLGDRGEAFTEEAFKRLRDLEVAAAAGKDVFPFTRGVLTALRSMGVKVAVITRSCLDVLKTVFPDLGEYAEAVVTREHTRDLKPHPGQIREVLALLRVSSMEAIVVGDHPTDIIAGRALWMETAGVLTGRTTREAFVAAGASYVLDDIRGLLDPRILSRQ
jgi:phosphoglycolate phosphatase